MIRPYGLSGQWFEAWMGASPKACGIDIDLTGSSIPKQDLNLAQPLKDLTVTNIC